MAPLSGLESLFRPAGEWPAALQAICLAGAVLFGCLCASVHAQAAEAERRDLELGNDRYSAGDALTFTTPVAGDLIAAGRTLAVDTAVGGMAIIAGGEVALSRRTEGSVFAAGRVIRLTGSVGSNVRMAGGQIDFGPQSAIAGNATLAGRNLNVEGGVDGYLLAAGQRIYLNGRIGGDVMVTGETVELGPNARIEGRVTYRAEEFTRADGAQVVGATEAMPPGERREGRGFPVIGLVVWSLGLALVAALCITMSAQRTLAVSETIQTRFGMSLGYGLLVLVGLPIVAVLALITLIGIPLGLLLLLAYPILLLLGYIHAAVALGDGMLRRFRSGTPAMERNQRILAALVAVMVLVFVSRVPFIGFVVCLLASAVGAGALAAELRRSRSAAAGP